jgi:Fic family protein
MKRRLKIIGKAISLKNGFFSVKQIAKETSIESAQVQIVLDRLFREGILQRFDLIPNPGEHSPLRGKPKKRTIYQVKDKGIFKERFAPKIKKDTAADAMWRLIRAKREGFTVRDLVVLGGARRENARWFVKMLFRGGYITPSKSGGPGVEWALIKFRDPGPKRPYLGKVN